jgi:large subunit ribosomal protein L5
MAKDASTKPKKTSKADALAAAADTGVKTTPRLKQQYDERVAKALREKFGLDNAMQTPRITSVSINVNMGRHLEGTKLPANVKSTVLDTITRISGQKPVVIKARKSVSNFKLRAGYEVAAMVTLRRDRMWHFLDRVFNLATPRIKDFRGLNPKAFDRQGNYAFGITEQGVFPEINMADVTFTHGMHIVITISKSNAEMSRFLLAELGMPFKKDEPRKEKAA